MRKKHRIQGYVLFFTSIAILFFLPFLFTNVSKLSSPEFIREIILSSGGFGYVMLVLLLLASIPLPVPSVPVILAGGYIYGTLLGSILSLFGIMVGSTFSFLLVRHFGKPLLKKLVDQHHITHFRHVFKKRGLAAVFISYAIPIFPSDAVSAMLGLTRISYRHFVMVVLIGHIPRILLINSLGEDFVTGFSAHTVVIISISLVFVALAMFREKAKKFFFKEIRELERETKVVEKDVERDFVKAERTIEKDTKRIEEAIEGDMKKRREMKKSRK